MIRLLSVSEIWSMFCIFESLLSSVYAVLRIRIRIRWIRKILDSWIRKNMRIHGSGSKGQNINQKLQKKMLFSKPKSDILKKERF